MPQCKKCGKKGLFLKIEEDTGMCLSCNEDFAKEGKILTEKIIEAKNKARTAKDPEGVVKFSNLVVDYGNELLALHQSYHLEPSQELVDLIETHKKIGEQA
ncbi:MAG: hypothetical protein AMK69_11780 [Nitrospira bacterium SG8_3]|nr:MAG: hypothetical protein AMK69_11780 [Nitrospira bacterium SG8_3]